MKRTLSIGWLLALLFVFQPLSGAPRIVDNSLGERMVRLFPELRDGYIDLNQNGSLDQLEDMDEMVPESRLRDDILQVQEIFDFLVMNYRYLPLVKLRAVLESLDDPRGAIPEILTINYRRTIGGLIAEREAMGDDGLYLSPSARRKALDTMEELISRLGIAYQKEWQKAESDFVSARGELFDLLARGYPVPEELLPEDFGIFESTLINAILPDREESEEITRTAIHTLGRIKSETAVPYLMDLLSSDYSKDAIRAIGAIGTPEAQSVLLARLTETEAGSPERLETIKALGSIGGLESADALLKLLQDKDTPPDEETEKALLGALATMAVGGYTDRRISTVLTDYTGSSDPALRTVAVRGLSYYPDQNSGLKVLETLKNDRAEEVSLAAVRASHRINHPAAVPTLVGMLRAGNVSPRMQEELIRAVGRHPDGVRGVINVLEFIGSEQPELRAAARDSLVRLYDGNEQTVAAALARGAAASGDELYQKEATALMAELADPGSLNTFTTLLTSPSPEVRKNVTWGLYRIGVAGNLRVQTALQKLVTSETEPLTVRINALRALARAGEDHPSMKLWQTYATTARMRGEKYSVLRLYALRGLGGLAGANDEVVSVLQRVAATEKDSLLRREAVTALHNLGTRNPSAEKALAELAGEKRDSSMEVRLAALRALGDMKSLETGPASRSLLAENPSPENKRLAVYALIQAENEPAYEVLFDLSTDEDVNELLIPLLEEADPAILEALIDRRLKREENEEIRSILEGVLAGYARSL